MKSKEAMAQIMKGLQRVAGALWEVAQRLDARREEMEKKGLVKPREDEGEDTDTQKFERAWVTTGIAEVARGGMCPIVLRGTSGHRRNLAGGGNK